MPTAEVCRCRWLRNTVSNVNTQQRQNSGLGEALNIMSPESLFCRISEPEKKPVSEFM